MNENDKWQRRNTERSSNAFLINLAYLECDSGTSAEYWSERESHLVNSLLERNINRKDELLSQGLLFILALAVIAMMAGCRSYAAIAEWGRTYHTDLPKALGFTHTKTPCASTLHYVFKDLDVSALENRLTQWALTVFEDLPTQTDTQALAYTGVINTTLL